MSLVGSGDCGDGSAEDAELQLRTVVGGYVTGGQLEKEKPTSSGTNKKFK